jgi:molybdopterin converting factor small subunit
MLLMSTLYTPIKLLQKIMNKINITLKVYGAFRDLVKGGSLTLALKENSTLYDLKILIEKEFSSKLIYQSVFANENKILPDSMHVKHDMTLSVLPPVCGG